MFLQNSLSLYRLRHGFFTVNFLFFVIFHVLLVDVRHIWDNSRFHGLSLNQYMKQFNFFTFVIKGFHDFRSIFLSKKKQKFYFSLLFFVYLLRCRNKPHITLFSYYFNFVWSSAIEHILRAEISLCCYDSVFWRVSKEFLFVAFLLFFS